MRAGGDKIVFPEGFDKGVLYTTVDRADLKQYRAVYARQAAVAAVFALGLMSKPFLITLPFVLLLLDYWPLERISAAVPAGAAAGTRYPAAQMKAVYI